MQTGEILATHQIKLDSQFLNYEIENTDKGYDKLNLNSIVYNFRKGICMRNILFGVFFVIHFNTGLFEGND